MKSYHSIDNGTNRPLHTILWEPEGQKPAALVQIVHGLAEHAERYNLFANHLCRSGYAVVAHDHPGHGKTETEHPGHIDHPDGFAYMAEQLGVVRQWAAERFPDLPQILFGHSMGSFLLQRHLQLSDNSPAGIIYSGSDGRPPAMLNAGIYISGLIARSKKGHLPSPLLFNLTFGGYNKQFKPVRTEADWLSRDSAMVDLYVDDPSSGFVCSAAFYHSLFKGLKELHQHQPFSGSHSDVPHLVLSGSDDPVSRMGKGIKSLESILRKDGVEDLTVTIYPGGRHEMLNEVNREEVFRDITEWIKARLQTAVIDQKTES